MPRRALPLALLLACAPTDADPPGTSETSTGGSEGGDSECAALREQAEAMAASGFSGVLGVYRADAPLLEWTSGQCIRANATPCASDSVFDIGSLTKQLTGAAIMALVEDGVLTVDDTLADHLPEVPEDKAAITIHQLLTHTAGFPDAIGDDYEAIDRTAYLARALAMPLLDPPGTRHSYSNVGYSILAAIVELRTGGSYERYLADRLLAPAGLLHTGYVLPDFSDVVVAHGYDGDDDMGPPNAQPWDRDGPWWNLRGNGGVLSTLDDLRRWDLALRSDVVLGEDARAQLFTPWVDEGYGDSFYGYGWVVIEYPGVGTVITHNGGNGWFFADVIRVPELELLVVLLSNAADDEWSDSAGMLAETALTACP